MSDESPVLTRQQWATCAAFLSAACGRPIAAETLEAYYAMLNDIPVSVLQMACRRAIQSEETTWLPSVGLIRKHAAEAVHGVLPIAQAALEEMRDIFDGTWTREEQAAAEAALPELTRRTWLALGGGYCRDIDTRETYTRKFCTTYDKLAKIELEMRKTSPKLRPAITGDSMVTPLIGEQTKKNSRRLTNGSN